MSYSEFWDEVIAHSGGLSNVRPPWEPSDGIVIKLIHRLVSLGKEDWDSYLIRLSKAEMDVLERWITAERYDGILAYAVSNFDTTGGDAFLIRFSKELESIRDVRRLRKLWKGILANRISCFGKPTVDDDPSLDSRKREVRNSVISAMEYFSETLSRLDESTEAEKIRDQLALFRSGQRRKSKRKPDQRTITEDIFWELIEESGKGVDTSTEQVEILTERLESFGLNEIRRFQKLLDQKMAESYTWNLWALAYIIMNGCSDDAFDYFRAWLILQGCETFVNSLRDIRSFSPIESGFDPQCEYLLYVAENAYENKKGEPMKPVSPPERRLTGEEWAEDGLQDRFPEVCARHSYTTHQR